MLQRVCQRLTKRCLTTASNAQAPLVIRNHRITASIILSRAPQITRDSTPFEKAYFDYKEKLERQNAEAFPTEFYFKKGSVAERRWKEEQEARQEAMQDPTMSLTEAVGSVQGRIEARDAAAGITTIVEKAQRITEADTKHNVHSLDRALQRTLYLVVHQPNDPHHPWQFPQGDLEGNEYLHETAQRQLKSVCGEDMDVWFVGRQPVSVYKESKQGDQPGRKVFFMKARVYAGQVKPSNQVSDFAWLTKEELEQYLVPDYYNSVKDCLGDI